MAVKAPALTTLTNFKTALRVSGSSDDTLIESIIDRATSWIESQTNRKLKARRYNNGASTHTTTTVADEDYIYFDGTTRDRGGHTDIDERGYGMFYLPAWPVRSNTETGSVTFGLATLSDRGSDVSGGESWDTSDLVEWDDYIVDRENGILRLLGGRFASGMRNYRVTMAAGYLTSAAPYVPDDLEQLCIELGKKVYKNETNLSSESIGSWSRSWDNSKKNPFVADTLARYTRFSL